MKKSIKLRIKISIAALLATLTLTVFSQNVWNAPSKFAQQVLIGSTGSFDNSAMLDVKSTTKGALLPRMTNAQMNAISSPSTGLIVFNTDSAKFFYYNGSAWASVSGSVSGNFWSITGNAGTTPGTNFIGTTDANNFWFGTNNTPRAYVANSGKVVKLYGDSTVQKLGFQKAYMGTSNDQGGVLLGPTMRYYMDTTGATGTAVVRAGDNITDWGDSLCIDLLAQHPDYGAVWDATLGMARVRLLLVGGANNGTAVVADTSRWFAANVMTNDTVFQIYTETGLAGIQYKNGTQGLGKVLTSDANGNATWQNSDQLFSVDSVATTGDTVDLAAGTYTAIMASGAITDLVLRFPASPSDNDRVIAKFDFAVTTLTSDGQGKTIYGFPASAAVGPPLEWRYDATTGQWH